jgi:hypothetical protein
MIFARANEFVASNLHSFALGKLRPLIFSVVFKLISVLKSFRNSDFYTSI